MPDNSLANAERWAAGMLSSEQLALPIVADNRSIGGLLNHIIGARFNWFYLWMGEGNPGLDPFSRTVRIGALSSACFELAFLLKKREHGLKQTLFGMVLNQTGPKIRRVPRG